MGNIKFDFKGRTAVITGASRGIGRAIANAFLKSGARVINLSRSEGTPVKDPGYCFVQKDVTDLEAIRSWIRKFTGKESIDIWINNAGIYPQSHLSKVKGEEWEETLATNTKAVLFVSAAVAEHMKKRERGTIVNMSSFAAYMPSLQSGVYAASKAAVISLTRSMASEWAPYNIRVNSCSPGVIRTDMTEALLKEQREKLMKPVPLARPGKPEELASAVLFLCSDEASYITGIDLQVTGGKFAVQNPEECRK